MKSCFFSGTKWTQILAILLPIGGCAPGPPPPVPPGLLDGLFNWLLLALLTWIVVLLLKKQKDPPGNGKKDQFTDALNAINERISALEEKVEQMKAHERHKERR